MRLGAIPMDFRRGIKAGGGKRNARQMRRRWIGFRRFEPQRPDVVRPAPVAGCGNRRRPAVHDELLPRLGQAVVEIEASPYQITRIAEALLGVTAHAARALGRPDRGRIAPGLKADLCLWDVARPGDLSYPLGLNPLCAVIRAGKIVLGRLP